LSDLPGILSDLTTTAEDSFSGEKVSVKTLPVQARNKKDVLRKLLYNLPELSGNLTELSGVPRQ
jgi:hypothetical protein